MRLTLCRRASKLPLHFYRDLSRAFPALGMQVCGVRARVCVCCSAHAITQLAPIALDLCPHAFGEYKRSLPLDWLQHAWRASAAKVWRARSRALFVLCGKLTPARTQMRTHAANADMSRRVRAMLDVVVPKGVRALEAGGKVCDGVLVCERTAITCVCRV
jgi:hypothetical protein